MQYGDIYLKCPNSGDLLWYDWTSFERFQSHYIAGFDKGRFIFVATGDSHNART